MPTIVQYELARWLGEISEEAAGQRDRRHSTRCVGRAAGRRMAVNALECAKASLAMADAIIYATAIEWAPIF